MDYIEQIKFVPELIKKSLPYKNDFMFIFDDNRFLVKQQGGEFVLPHFDEIRTAGIKLKDTFCFGSNGESKCHYVEAADITELNEAYAFYELRYLSGIFDINLFHMCCRALHMIKWAKKNNYCGRCGTSTSIKEDENAKICPQCGNVIYPRISPAVIVAVVKDKDKLLLAHNVNFQEGHYSVIAGFVEPGETFEECVSREVREEVGIEVKNIKYFGSQPWPFPDSLMVGFTAEYADGEIRPDEIEISDAKWHRADELPKTPTSGSIARKLIQWFVENNI